MSAFELGWVDRSTSRELWATYRRIIRKSGGMPSPHDESLLAERVQIKAQLDHCTEDGNVCIVESGMDCDSVRYCHGRVKPTPTVIAYMRDCDSMYEWADGPCHMGICKPSERPESYSRDLAMEAFENGHPHYISY